jgi:hypothetical protein
VIPSPFPDRRSNVIGLHVENLNPTATKPPAVVARYVPVDSGLSSEEAGYPIIKILPAVFSLRRDNRG